MRRVVTMASVLVALSAPGAASAQNSVASSGSVTIRASLSGTPSEVAIIPMACPVPGAKFINDWGMARSGGRSHEGTDMMAPHGTPVLAPVAGSVKHDSSGRGGLQFWLTADDGRRYFGAHLSAFGSEGRVAAGAVIGYVGSTGNAGTPHLHFEIHPEKNRKVNPFVHVRAACSAGATFAVTIG